jgi:ketosteroid isomerase-like protein
MSQENVENLRTFLKAWTSAGSQWSGLDMSLLDPDVTFEASANMPDMAGEIYRGHDGVVRATKRWIEAYEWLSIDLERIVGAGDRLVSIHRWRAKARHTGIVFDTPVAYVWTFRDGRVVHYRAFSDPKHALKAAGLEV